ncbi:cytidine/deoxycytidylate deaminase family protein [Alkalicella caledoniensis]|uniref:Cytidine/deoxycytidylate deaminase family protein n=1 Tax=Alkalicella caledoniensis TaxID=2731377 RepID=A0A7G9W900_ALKCA|nr:cytidine/deoxycytidylate deaminase family protein [Alkalicella caledoniensis]QNO15162.1 cytidine/deoxycytidylate deaminase family protein [Alkalicella caledoniensis]
MIDYSEQSKEERPSWDHYFMEITQVVAKRSTCLRRQVGALLVKDKRILSSGYNGAPSNLPHCSETGCLRQQLNIPSGERHELCRGLHAEQNAIVHAAMHGISIKDATIYITNQPCVLCAKMIINGGIKRVVFLEGYPDKLSEEMLKQASVDIIKI